MKDTAIYALTPQGARLSKTLADLLEADLFLPARLADSLYGRSSTHEIIPFVRIFEAVAKNFFLYPKHVFIAATGIVVRAISPHLKSKDLDPAVIVLDLEGKYVISLLSGHLGGANELARMVAKLTGGEAVITTATDAAGVPSMDLLAKENDLTIANLEAVKSINMALVAGEPVQIFDPENRLGLKNKEQAGFAIEQVYNKNEWINEYPGVWVTWKNKKPDTALKQLMLHPRCLVAGVGCNRGTNLHEIIDLIRNTFQKNGLSMKSLKYLTSIEAKRDEPGLNGAARELDVPLIFFRKSELEAVKVPHPSSVVKKHMGASSVCEATALLKTGGGRLLVPKTKSRNATLAVALES